MDERNDTMLITLAGEGIAPETIRAKDLADIIVSVEESLLGIAAKQHPDLETDQLVIGLVNIEQGSAKLRFRSQLPSVAAAAFITLTGSISSNDYGSLPASSVKAVRKISEFTRRRHCTARFELPDRPNASAQLGPETQVEMAQDAFVKGETTVYGLVERVGGANPRVVVRTAPNKALHCAVGADVAKELATHLYAWVGLRGVATWATEDYSIAEFTIEAITEYRDAPLTDSMAELSRLIASYWDDERDVVKAVEDMRGAHPS